MRPPTSLMKETAGRFVLSTAGVFAINALYSTVFNIHAEDRPTVIECNSAGHCYPWIPPAATTAIDWLLLALAAAVTVEATTWLLRLWRGPEPQLGQFIRGCLAALITVLPAYWITGASGLVRDSLHTPTSWAAAIATGISIGTCLYLFGGIAALRRPFRKAELDLDTDPGLAN